MAHTAPGMSLLRCSGSGQSTCQDTSRTRISKIEAHTHRLHWEPGCSGGRCPRTSTKTCIFKISCIYHGNKSGKKSISCFIKECDICPKEGVVSPTSLQQVNHSWMPGNVTLVPALTLHFYFSGDKK